MKDLKAECKLSIIAVEEKTLTGQVEITTISPILIEEAIVEITGTAQCQFKLGKMRIKFPCIHTRKCIVSRHENFYYLRYPLCIQARHYYNKTYPFRGDWPAGMPGTWVNERGSVKYLGKVTMHSNNMMYTHTQDVFVQFTRNLLLERRLIKAGEAHVSRRLMLIKSLGDVSVDVWTPITGFALGQSLPVLCTVDNQSELHFGGLVFVLTRIDVYRSEKPFVDVKKVRTDVCRIARMVDIHRGRYEYFALMKIDNDLTPSLNYEKCRSFEIWYELWVSVQGTILRNNRITYRFLHTPVIPITIGTIPLSDYNPSDITQELFEQMKKIHRPNLSEQSSRMKIDMVQLFAKTETTHEDSVLSETCIENLRRELKLKAEAAAKQDETSTI